MCSLPLGSTTTGQTFLPEYSMPAYSWRRWRLDVFPDVQRLASQHLPQQCPDAVDICATLDEGNGVGLYLRAKLRSHKRVRGCSRVGTETLVTVELRVRSEPNSVIFALPSKPISRAGARAAWGLCQPIGNHCRSWWWMTIR